MPAMVKNDPGTYPMAYPLSGLETKKGSSRITVHIRIWRLMATYLPERRMRIKIQINRYIGNSRYLDGI